MSSFENDWSILQPPPNCLFTRLLPLNNHEFIVVPVTNKEYQKEYKNCDGIYKYNSILKKWTKIMNYPKEFQSINHIATIDNKNKIIYILNDNSIFIKIDLNTKTIEKTHCNIPHGTFPGIVYINGNIHVIGGKGIIPGPGNMHNRKHFIFNEKDRIFRELDDFKKNIFPIPIYLNKTKSIMAITDDYYPLMEYRNNTWQQIKIIKHEYPGTTVVTTSQDFMIFLQVRSLWTNNGIFVYNLKNGTMHKSKVRVPEIPEATAIITRNDERDEILTFGFIRKCYKANDLKQIQDLPFYLIKFIGKWICHENVHFIGLSDDGKHTHWMMDVDKIINS